MVLFSDKTGILTDFLSRLKSFSFYHAFILLTVSYVAIAGGATIGYNVFGQYIPGMFFKLAAIKVVRKVISFLLKTQYVPNGKTSLKITLRKTFLSFKSK